MRLSPFIRQNLEAILSEWESFARIQSDTETTMSRAALREHAGLMLEAISTDIEQTQTAQAQEEKGKGNAPVKGGLETAAASHGTDREGDGFTLVQLMAEFRAVRASVLRLWLPTIQVMDEATFRDMIRFNEAIDQAIAESVETYSDALTRTRDTFLGCSVTTCGAASGHCDIRIVSGQGKGDPTRKASAAARIVMSASLMSGMVNGLLDYARMQLGGVMSIEPQQTDLQSICRTAIEDARALHPDCEFALDATDAAPGADFEQSTQQRSSVSSEGYGRDNATIVECGLPKDCSSERRGTDSTGAAQGNFRASRSIGSGWRPGHSAAYEYRTWVTHSSKNC